MARSDAWNADHRSEGGLPYKQVMGADGGAVYKDVDGTVLNCVLNASRRNGPLIDQMLLPQPLVEVHFWVGDDCALIERVRKNLKYSS